MKLAKSAGMTASLASLWLGLSPAVVAHGGKYEGPRDTVPPSTGSPGDSTPPSGTGTGTTVPPPSTTPAGRGPAHPTSPGGQPPVGTPGQSRPSTGLGKHSSQTGSYEQWEFWWEANDDAFLGLKERLRKQDVFTEGVGGIGRSRAADDTRRMRVNGDDLARIRAALLVSLASDEADIVDSAALALARITPADQGADLVAPLVKTLGHREATARQAAVLALGVLGAPEAGPVLRELLLDTPEGRRLTGQGQHVEEFVRAFAAASLGLLGEGADIQRLEQVIQDSGGNATTNVKALAVAALGMVKERHDTIVPFLQQLLGDRSLDVIVRAQAPIALARLAEQPTDAGAVRGVLAGLADRLLDAKSAHQLHRSLAVALGRIATIDDGAVLDALLQVSSGSRDEQTRRFATMALAEIGVRDRDPDHHRAEQLRLQARFEQQLQSPKPLTERPYGALALAVWARNPQLSASVREEAASRIDAVFMDENNPSYQGACAIALGLLDAKASEPELARCFGDKRDPALRGYLAVASGMLGDRSQAQPVRELLEKKGLDSQLRLQLARSLGLMADPRAIPALLENLRTAETVYETSSTAKALGLIGDRRAVEPLLALLADPQQAPLRRGFAAVGLGLLAEKSELPWNSIFTMATNYRARTATLVEITDIL